MLANLPNDFMVADLYFPELLPARPRSRRPNVAQYAIALDLNAGDATSEPR